MSDAQEMERFFRERGFGQLIGWGGVKPGTGLKLLAHGAAFTPAP